MQSYQDVLWQVNQQIEQAIFRVPDSFISEYGPNHEKPYLDFTPWPIRVTSLMFSDGTEMSTAGGGGGGQNQTPWLSDINAARFSLFNVNQISSFWQDELILQGGPDVRILDGGNTANITVGNNLVIIYPGLEVDGDINITGQYLVNGLPFGAPAPPNQSVQWNNNGAFGGSGNLIWDSEVLLTVRTDGSRDSGFLVQGPAASYLAVYNRAAYGLTISANAPLNVNGSPLAFSTGDIGRMWIDMQGRVGIGVSTPQFPLDVYGTDYIIRAYNPNDAFAGIVIDHIDPGGDGDSVISFRYAGIEAAVIQYDTGEDNLTFWTGGTSNFTATLILSGDNKVGVLQSDPAYELDVLGDCNISGRLSLPGLPTSSAGLNPGDVWNNGGVLNIV